MVNYNFTVLAEAENIQGIVAQTIGFWAVNPYPTNVENWVSS